MTELSDSSATLDPKMSPYAESLLAHSGWVRQLARTLVGDPNLADDLVQETWVKALQEPPIRGNLRAWLATVLRNLARQRHRADARRQRHEARGPRCGPTPPTSDLVEQVATEKHIVEVVLALSEPCRTAVLMRFYENLPPRKIAAQLGVPVSTVHTRITRGLEKLRLQLDQEFGERRTWMLALIPSVLSAPTAGPILGAATMSSKTTVILGAAAVLVLGTAIAWPLIDSSGPVADEAATEVTATGDGRRPAAAAAPDRGVTRRAVATAPDPANQRLDMPAPITVRGRLVDADATPLAGHSVGFADGPKWSPTQDRTPTPVTQTSEDGRFELQIPRSTGTIRVAEAGWRTVLAPVVDRDTPRDALVVAARSIELAGRVVDENGRGVPGAHLQVEVPKGFHTRFGEAHDSAIKMFEAHVSAGDGRFTVPDACFIDKAHLAITKPGHAQQRLPLPPAGNRDLVVRLPHLTAQADDTISGQVLDQRGQIVAGAWVTLGRAAVQSDDLGNFTLRKPERGPVDTLLAIKKGLRPGRLRRSASGAWPDPLVLRLGGAPLTIAGRVLDADGKGVANARVWVYDGEFGGRVDSTTTTVQGLVTGAPTRSEIMQMIRKQGRNPREVLSTTSTAMWPFTRTGADGSFRIEGLDDRRYTLRAMLDHTLLMAEVDDIAGDTTDAVIRFGKDAYYPRLSGRVVSMKGRPVANAEIYTMCDPARIVIGEGASTQHQTAQRRRTDAAGRFEFERVPRNLVYLRVDHKDILSIEYGRGNPGGLAARIGANTQDIEIQVQARVHVKISLRQPERADTFAAVDADGHELRIVHYQGAANRATRRQPLHDGKSGVVVIPESATKLVFYKGTDKVDAMDINLIAGRVNEIEK